MIISFDLDDTLFVDPKKIPTERSLKFPFNHFFTEKMRSGTVDLLLKIRQNDIKLWIYTTSFRSENYIRGLFRCYGIKIDNIINGQRHQKEVQGSRFETLPSKYPSKYRIDLHVDDDISVLQNGKIYGFKVYLIKNDDIDWASNIWNEIKKISSQKNSILSI